MKNINFSIHVPKRTNVQFEQTTGTTNYRYHQRNNKGYNKHQAKKITATEKKTKDIIKLID